MQICWTLSNEIDIIQFSIYHILAKTIAKFDLEILYFEFKEFLVTLSIAKKFWILVQLEWKYFQAIVN